MAPAVEPKAERCLLAEWLRLEAAKAIALAVADADEHGAQITRQAAAKLERAAALIEEGA